MWKTLIDWTPCFKIIPAIGVHGEFLWGRCEYRVLFNCWHERHVQFRPPPPARRTKAMAKLTKLTRMLIESVMGGDTYSVRKYAPAKAAVKAGWLEWVDADDYSGHLRVTPAGRRALEEA